MSPLSEHDVDRVRPVMWIYMPIAGDKLLLVASRVMRRNADGSHSGDITHLEPGIKYVCETSEVPGKLYPLYTI
jgi:hypothetical protein